MLDDYENSEVEVDTTVEVIETMVYEESRPWQLAIDSVPLATTSTARDTAILAGNEIHDGEGRHVVTIGRDTIYIIFTDGTGIVSYYKSTDGGVSWGAVVTITAQTDSQNIGVWYDGWTPGLDTGLIHVVWGETGGDDVYYDYIDTQNSDAQRGEIVAVANGGATHTAITDSISVTRTTDGDVFVAFSSSFAGSTTLVRYSTDLGANWNTTADEGIDDVSGDWVMLMPLASADVLLLRWDLSANTILSREYEDNGNTWEGGAWPTAFAGTAADQANFTEVWGASLDPSNNNIYFAYIDDAGLTTADILTYSYDGSSWTAGGSFLTNITTLQGIAVGYDPREDDIYIAYNRGTAEASLSPFYKKSTDGGANWGPQIGAVSLAAVDDYKSLQMSMISDEQLVMWMQDDDDNDMFWGQVADLGVQGRSTNFTFIDGFEENDIYDTVAASLGSPNAPNTLPRTGDYSLQINPSAVTEYVTYNFYSATTGAPSAPDIDMMSMNIALYIDDDPSVNANILQILDSASATVATVQLETTTRQLNLTATNTASGSTNLSEDTWYILNLNLDSDNSSQSLKIYSSDMKILYETLSLTDSIVDHNQVRIGLMTVSTGVLYFDDLIVSSSDLGGNDSLLVGNYAIRRMDLDSNGASTAFTTGCTCTGCNGGNDWEWVVDIPIDNANYVESATNGAAETYGLESASAAGITGEIYAVKGMTTRWESTSGTSAGAAVRISANSANSDSATLNATATAGTDYFRILPYPPGTGQPLWTTSLLDSMEIGQTSGSSINVRFGRAEVEVLYIPTIDISGTCDAYDQTTDCGDTGTVRVAINGILQEQVQTTVAGTWTISSVPAPSNGDVITVFIDGAAASDEAVAVTKYNGSGNVGGVALFKEHLSIGSDDNQTITNTNLSQFDNSVSGDEDIFFDVNSGALTVDSLAQSSQEELYIKTGNTFQPGGSVTTHDLEIVGTFVPEANTVSIGGSYLNSGTLTAGTSSFVFNSGSTGETIVSGGTGATKDFYDIQLNNSAGGWTIQTNNLTTGRNFAITDTAASGFTVNSVVLEVKGTYSIADSVTANTTWTSATLYLNSGSAYSVGSKSQSAETYSTLQIGANTDIRTWNSSATTTTVDSSGSLYSQDHANTNGDLYIWGDYHTQTNDYWSYATDFDGTNISGGSERQVDVRIDPASSVTADSGDTLAAIGTSGNRTSISRQGGANGYSFTIGGATVNLQYTDFDYLDGPLGLDIQTSSTVTSLDNNKFDNLVNSGTDAFVTIASAVIGAANKTITGVQFDNTGSGANCNVNRTGSDDTGYWDFDASTGTFDGEASDCKAGANEDDPGMLRWDDSSGSNQTPNDPTTLAQKKTDNTVITTGEWINENSVKFTAVVDDPDSSDTLYLCFEAALVGGDFSDTEDTCGTGVAYSGLPVAVEVTLSGITNNLELHWQVRVKDTAGAYSNWVQYGGNAESATDFGVDTLAATGGTVYDGTSVGVDTDFNDGSLSALSANWSGFDANASGLLRYEYSIGTSVGGTQVVNWTTNSTTTSVTASGLTLQTSVMYYFNVRAVDNAGNVQTPVISSSGQTVAPTLTFSVSPSSVTFSNLNSGNSFNDTENTTLTTSTNAYNGYVVRAFLSGLLTSTLYADTISNFDGGSYVSPDEWLAGDRGFGYTSSDTSVQGNNIFGSTPCLGGGDPPCYAPFATSAPGDIVADHTSTVSGTPISNEAFTVTYQVKTGADQVASPYSTTVIYTITPVY